MDPNTALENACKAQQALMDILDERQDRPSLNEVLTRAYSLAESFEALDGWLRRGGFLPRDWAAGR